MTLTPSLTLTLTLTLTLHPPPPPPPQNRSRSGTGGPPRLTVTTLQASSQEASQVGYNTSADTAFMLAEQGMARAPVTVILWQG